MKFEGLRAQLNILMLLFFLALLACAGWGAYAKRQTMIDDRVQQMRTVVDLAEHAVERQQAMVQAGNRTDEEAQKIAADEIATMHFGADGYIGVLGRDHTVLVHPDAAVIGKNMDDFRDPDGVQVFQDLVNESQAAGSAIVHYRFAKPNETAPEPKVTFARFDPKWQWTLFSGVYLDDIDTAFYASLKWQALLFAGIAVLLMTGLRTLLNRTTLMPLANAVGLCERIAAGNLAVSIDASRGGEIGRLLTALRHMQDQLARAVGSVRQTSTMVARASQQLATDSAHLSERSGAQAAALEQSAAAMAELTSTVKNNAENSRQAMQVSQTASRTAEEGKQVVDKVVDTMQAIAAGSRRIEDITSVIDGIAFQTNILALNAAVEAARAGTAGQGFAVVATEVRLLAQRSATAAKEIQTLIGESVEQVSSGATLVTQAGAKMDEVVGSVQRVNHLIAEISAASQEQSDGIEQVHQSIALMDQSTQDNALLVDKSAAASSTLSGHSQQLLDVVSVFTLGAPSASGSHVGAVPRAAIAGLTPEIAY